MAEALAIDTAATSRYVLGRRTPLGGYCTYPRAREPPLGIQPPEADRATAWLQRLQDGQGGFATLMISWATLQGPRLLRRAPARSALWWVRQQARAPRASRGKRSATVLAARRVSLSRNARAIAQARSPGRCSHAPGHPRVAGRALGLAL